METAAGSRLPSWSKSSTEPSTEARPNRPPSLPPFQLSHRRKPLARRHFRGSPENNGFPILVHSTRRVERCGPGRKGAMGERHSCRPKHERGARTEHSLYVRRNSGHATLWEGSSRIRGGRHNLTQGNL